ncbi:1,25-dihydroxyvitamin D(3) 24-hydroxylase, mitochondrial-like isoform X2 [Biomphalaria glabrata]|nr:1,25-dihydroxyvitamin D(3) 24-hydroxylase, mitochondrial-like isoform X2 [Biomphalaria glabrata]XP_055891105.1 1,25-dihydroxyvitamin D(3) 24-hydroxylase, mitochondrial-like isoform X2 [Biomphalaria glabrata]XP_055891106.1 1,25-dihydroxyvitamin D(3) 24-hydroxylase, mitochondrial-like isoform X2 [Biomphalaria glabrata]KAI8746495.1 1,25-dihydroxyvitamin D(3) 24-hydroxylase, mitochondrial [Biomphalaria glabrata]
MSDIALRRALGQGARVLRQTRAMFTTSATEEATAPTASTPATDIKPFTDLPGPKGWPILGSFPDYFKKENQGQMHELMRRRHRQFGKIFREQFGPRHNVAVADPALLEEILRKEGKYPSRPPYESWVLYNTLRNRQGGLMTSDKEYWRRSRSALATKLRPKAVSDYVEGMNQVCVDLVDRIGYLKDEKGGTHLVPRLLNELNKFTMETILYIMLNKRIGCLDREVSEKVNNFIQSIATMFLTGHQLMVYANLHKLLRTRPWKEHVQSWDKIYDFAADLINQRIDEVSKELESGETVEGEHVDFMKYVVSTHQLSRNEIVDNIIEIFMGGIDTTANSLAFLFYLLAKNEHIQTKLIAEIDNVLGKRQPGSSDLQNMSYLKACVKETLRLFPPIPMNARTTTEDMTIGGYFIPKDTILMLNVYVMSHDENIFPDPDEFRPDRWMRGEEEVAPSPFSFVPFGFGTRSCVGRRIAESQIYLATIQILQRYWLKKSDKFDIKPSVRTQFTPGPELPVMFVER